MNIKLVQLFGCLFVLFFAAPVSAEDRTVEEFKEYIIEKTGDLLNERQLDAVVEKVDSDSDGTITDEEFETRHEAIREVLAESVPDKAESDEDSADSTEDSKESTEDPAESDEDTEKSDEDSDPKSDDSADSPEDSEPKPDENEASYESLEPVVIQPLTDSTDASVLLITERKMAKSQRLLRSLKSQQTTKRIRFRKRFGCAFVSTSRTTPRNG